MTTTYSSRDWATADIWGPAVRRVWSGSDLARAAFLLLVANFAVAVPALAYMSDHPEMDPAAVTYNPLVLAGGMLALWLVFGGYPLYVTLAKGARSLAHDFGWSFARRDVLVGLVAGLSLRFADLAASAVAGRFIDMTDGDNSNWLAMDRPVLWTMGFAIGAAVVAPALEELFFRGFVLKTVQRMRFARSHARSAGVIVSSVAFGAMHTTAISAGGLYVAITTGAIGAVLGLMAVRFRRLGPAVFTHIIFNMTGVAAALLAH